MHINVIIKFVTVLTSIQQCYAALSRRYTENAKQSDHITYQT